MRLAGGTGAGMPAQPVRDGLTRLQGTERDAAALPHKGRGGGQRPFRGIFRLYGGFLPDHGGVQRRHRLQKSLPAPRFLVSPGTGSPEPTRYRPRGGMRPHNSKTAHIEYILKLRYDELLHFLNFCQTKGQGYMFKIIEKKQLSADVFYMKVTAPDIARNRKAGQFVLVQLDTDYGERVPLTIADADGKAGWIALVFQAVGATTLKLSRKQEGDCLAAILGPLGNPTHIEKVGTVVCVGGGIGVAPLHPIVQAYKAAGNKVIVIMGARNKDLLIFENEMRALADELIIMTDDGSAGTKGLVTEPLKTLCEQNPKPDEVVAIGPPVMMKFCAATTKPYGVHTVVSLNTIMIDGTGMCGGCRVTVGGETKFVCVDGPEFDGHLVDFDNMMMRMKAFKTREQEDLHKCRMQAQADTLAGGN